MKKNLFMFTLFSFSLLISAQSIDSYIDKQKVAVIPLWFDEDEIEFGEELSSTVQTSIQWMLRMIEGYEVFETE